MLTILAEFLMDVSRIQRLLWWCVSCVRGHGSKAEGLARQQWPLLTCRHGLQTQHLVVSVSWARPVLLAARKSDLHHTQLNAQDASSCKAIYNVCQSFAAVASQWAVLLRHHCACSNECHFGSCTLGPCSTGVFGFQALQRALQEAKCMALCQEGCC